MIRVRFHGRGGHGIKTASRILGTAAFLEGYYVQDAPVYGAERRGAPISAYTRISDRPLLERGVILNPDIVVIADETLLYDPMASPIQGVTPDTVVAVNTSQEPHSVVKNFDIKGRVITLDMTGISLQVIGKASVLSGVAGALACRLVRHIKVETMAEAIQKELTDLHLSPEIIEKNLAAAFVCYEKTPPMELGPSVSINGEGKLITPVYVDPMIGTASIYAKANTPMKKTGTWRIFRPQIEMEKCSRCRLCYIACPEGAITLDKDEYPHIEYDNCKGCMICYEECPTGAILEEKEVKAW